MYIPSPVASESQGWSAIVLALEIRTDLSYAMPTERETFEEGWLLAEAEAGAGRSRLAEVNDLSPRAMFSGMLRTMLSLQPRGNPRQVSFFPHLSQLLLFIKDQRIKTKFGRILRKFYLEKENCMEPRLPTTAGRTSIA